MRFHQGKLLLASGKTKIDGSQRAKRALVGVAHDEQMTGWHGRETMPEQGALYVCGNTNAKFRSLYIRTLGGRSGTMPKHGGNSRAIRALLQRAVWPKTVSRRGKKLKNSRQPARK
jgi:hypothetical protein